MMPTTTTATTRSSAATTAATMGPSAATATTRYSATATGCSATDAGLSARRIGFCLSALLDAAEGAGANAGLTAGRSVSSRRLPVPVEWTDRCAGTVINSAARASTSVDVALGGNSAARTPTWVDAAPAGNSAACAPASAPRARIPGPRREC